MVAYHSIMYSNVDNVKQSLKLAWGYKILWVFALVAAASSSAGGGGGGNNTSQDSIKNLISPPSATEREYDIYNPDGSSRYPWIPNGGSPFGEIIDEGEKVLGAVSIADINELPLSTDSKSNNFKSLTPYLVFLIPTLTLLFLFAVLIGLITKSWAVGSLVAGTKIGIDGGNVNLREISEVGLIHIKKIILLSILTCLLQFALILITLGPSGVAFLLGKTLIGILLLIPGILFLALYTFYLVRSNDFGLRFIVLKNSGVVQALKSGYGLVKPAFLRVIGLSVLNTLVSGLLSFLVFLPGIIVVVISSGFLPKIISEGNFTPGIVAPVAMVAAIFGILMIFAITALSGFLGSFKNFTWTNMFLFMTDDSSAANIAITEKDGPTNSSVLLQGHHNLLKEMRADADENGGTSKAI